MSTLTPPTRPMPASQPPRGPARARTTGLAANVDPLKVLRRHLTGIILATIVGAGIGVAAYVLFAQFMPRYSGEVLFEIQPGLQESTSLATTERLETDTVKRIAATEAVIVRSRPVLEAAMRNPLIRQTDWHRKYPTSDGGFDEDAAIDDLVEEIGAGLKRGTAFLHISWSAEKAADVPIVLNAIKDAYKEKRQRDHRTKFAANRRLFEDNLAETNNALETLKTETQNFIEDRGITTLEDPKSTQTARTLAAITQQITNTNATLSQANTAYEATAAKLEGVLEPTPEDFLMAERDPLVQRQDALILNLETLLAEKRIERAADSNIVRRYEEQLQAAMDVREIKVDQVLQRNLKARLDLLANEMQRAQTLKNQLAGEADELDLKLREITKFHHEYEQLAKRADYLEEVRSHDLSLIKEVQLLQVRADAQRVLEAMPAQTPRQMSFPKLQIMVPLGALLVGGLMIGLVFLREFVDQRIKSPSDLQVIPHATVLGVVPDMGEDPTSIKSADLVVARHPRSVLAESYRQTAGPIIREMERAGHEILLMVGGLPGAGTSTMIGNVAATLAAAGKRVLVIDANFRRPRMAKMFGLEPDAPGLGDVLVDQASLDEAIQQTGEGVNVLAAGSAGSRVFERLALPRFDSVVAEVRDRFDVVLIDSAPAVVAGDATILANKADATVLVVRANQEKRGLVARLINQFSDARSVLLGLVLNRPKGTAGGYFRKNFATMARYSSDKS